MSKEKIVSDNFLTICDRVKNELGIKKDKQLLEFIQTTQPTFSRRKIEDNFSIEWAYLISIKTIKLRFNFNTITFILLTINSMLELRN